MKIAVRVRIAFLKEWAYSFLSMVLLKCHTPFFQRSVLRANKKERWMGDIGFEPMTSTV
jgi:hypothetical protein